MENKKLIEYSELSRKLERLDQQETEMQQAENVDYEKLAELRSERLRLKDQAEAVEQEALSAEVTVDHVAKVIELWTGIPASKIKETELAKVAGLADALKRKVIGQDEAVGSGGSSHPPQPGTDQPQTASGFLHLCRAHRCGQDRAGQGAGFRAV